jgi:1-deoxy-D-xylulose-5-phosphate reductoisomerase
MIKKKIAILGSTGSIGTSLTELININEFEIIFLSTNKNYQKLFKQAKKLKVKNLIVFDDQSYKKALFYNKNKKTKIYNNLNFIDKIVPKKLDYVMSSISGIDGLKSTFSIIKHTKKIAIANKESLICAWPIIKKELKKFNTEFVPVDSEHFSIWTEIKNIKNDKIKKIYLTASGGPLLKYYPKSLKKVKMKTVLKHPTWKMGKKISVDSATMMNKCYEVMEAKNIFNLDYDKISIIIEPTSYIHAIILFNNGFSKAILHDTTMKIPIFNTIYTNNEIYPKFNDLNFTRLNNLNFQNVEMKKYPLISLLKKLPKKHSMFETVIVSINDAIVNKYLEGKINFSSISKLFLKLINLIEFKVYKKIYPTKIEQIIKLNNKINYSVSKLINERNI